MLVELFGVGVIRGGIEVMRRFETVGLRREESGERKRERRARRTMRIEEAREKGR